MAANLKQLIQDFVVPEFRALQGELKRLDEKLEGIRIEVRSEFHRLDEKIDSFEKKVQSELHRLDEKIDSLDKRVNQRLDSLEKQLDLAIDIHERLASLEAKIGH